MVFTGRDEDVTVRVGGDASGANSALDAVIGKLGSIPKATAVAGGALAAMGGVALAKATESAASFEAQMADVAKVTSEGTAGALEDDIMRLSEQIPVARSELVSLSEQAGKFGVEGEENIAQFVETAGKMSTAMDLPADELGRRMAKIAQATDTPISQIDKLGNATNALADSMKTDANEITSTAQRAGIALSDRLGLGTDQVLSLSAAMNEVSPTARRAAGSLRTMTASLMDPKNVEDLAAALGMTPDEFKRMREENPEELMEQIATGLQGNTEQSEALANTLGKRGVESFSRFASAMESTDEAQQTVNQQFEEGTSLQREMELRTNTLHGQLQLLQDALGNVATKVGQQLLPIVKEFVGGLRDFIGAVSGLLDGSSELSGQFEGIADVVADLVEMFVDAGESILEAFQPTFDAIESILTDNTDEIMGLVDSWMGGFQGLINFFQTVVLPAYRFVFERVIAPITNAVMGVVAQNVGPVLSEIGQTINVLVGVATTLGNVMLGVWNSIDGVVVPIVEGLTDILKTGVVAVVGTLIESLKLVMNLVQGDFGAAFENLKSILSTGFDAAIDILGIIKDGLEAAAGWLLETGKDILLGAFDFITDTEEGLPAMLVDAISGGLSDLVSGTIQWIQDLAERVASAIKGAIKDAVTPDIEVRGEEATLGDVSRTVGLETDTGDQDAQTGGLIERGGRLNVHAGERIVPAAQVTDRGGVGPQLSPRDLERAVRRALDGATIQNRVEDQKLDQVMEDTAEIVFQRGTREHARRLERRGTF